MTAKLALDSGTRKAHLIARCRNSDRQLLYLAAPTIFNATSVVNEGDAAPGDLLCEQSVHA